MGTKKALKQLRRAKKIEARRPLATTASPVTASTGHVTHSDFTIKKLVDLSSPK
jgi:type VI protein secretion system component Hcp